MSRANSVQREERFDWIADVAVIRAARAALPVPRGMVISDYEMSTRSGKSGRTFKSLESFIDFVESGVDSFSYGSISHSEPGATSIAGVRLDASKSGTHIILYAEDDEIAAAMLNAIRAVAPPVSRRQGRSPGYVVPASSSLDIDDFHPQVVTAAAGLFRSGNCFHAELEAFKSLEVRVKALTGLEISGDSLMTRTFNPSSPILNMSTDSGRSGADQQKGFMYLFQGAMAAVRNPKAHVPHRELELQTTLEYLAFASLLHRRLDIAEGQLRPPDE